VHASNLHGGNVLRSTLGDCTGAQMVPQLYSGAINGCAWSEDDKLFLIESTRYY
jgi:hypothetical protein